MNDPKAKPKVNSSLAEKELDKAQAQFQAFDDSVKEMTMDRLNATPKEETEPQTKLSSRELSSVKDHYLKPHKIISCRDKFNEKFRAEYNHAKVYVPFIAENNELKGDTIDIWTRPFPGMPAEEWLVPTNKPIWAPRYVAEQLKRKYYHRLVMQENKATGSDGTGQYYGQMAADTTVQRLDAHPVNTERKSIFMGADGN
jgi:hypothetical protein